MMISTSQKSFQFFPYYVLFHRQELDFHHPSYIYFFDKFLLHVTKACLPLQLLLCKWPAHPAWPSHRGKQHHLDSGAPCRLPSFINPLDGHPPVLCSTWVLNSCAMLPSLVRSSYLPGSHLMTFRMKSLERKQGRGRRRKKGR